MDQKIITSSEIDDWTHITLKSPKFELNWDESLKHNDI